MNTPTEYTVALTKGAMTVGALAAGIMLLISVFNLQILSWIIFIGGICLGMRSYKNVLGGIIAYSQALNVGFQTAFFASLILAFFAFMNTTMNSSLIVEFLDAAEEQLKTSGMPTIMVENAMQNWREILTPTIFGLIIIFTYSAAGGFLSLILAFLFKNAKREEIGI